MQAPKLYIIARSFIAHHDHNTSTQRSGTDSAQERGKSRQSGGEQGAPARYIGHHGVALASLYGKAGIADLKSRRMPPRERAAGRRIEIRIAPRSHPRRLRVGLKPPASLPWFLVYPPDPSSSLSLPFPVLLINPPRPLSNTWARTARLSSSAYPPRS